MIHEKKSVVECVIEAFTQLVTNTGKNTSLYKQFHIECDQDEIPANFTKYHQRHFATLGYVAGKIIHFKPQLISLLKKYSKNLLSHACQIYINDPFIINALCVLARITENVTLPFLIMVQKSDQSKLVDLLPQLFHELKEGRYDSLNEFKEPFNLILPI